MAVGSFAVGNGAQGKYYEPFDPLAKMLCDQISIRNQQKISLVVEQESYEALAFGSIPISSIADWTSS